MKTVAPTPSARTNSTNRAREALEHLEDLPEELVHMIGALTVAENDDGGPDRSVLRALAKQLCDMRGAIRAAIVDLREEPAPAPTESSARALQAVAR